MNNAIQAFAKGLDPDNVIMLIDDTDAVSAEAGCIFSTDGLWVKDAAGERQIPEIPDGSEWSVKSSNGRNELILNKKTIFTFSHPSVERMTVLADMLNRITQAAGEDAEDADEEN